VLDIQLQLGAQRTIGAAEREYDRLKEQAKLVGAEYQMRVQSAITSAGRPISSPPLIARSLAIPGNLVKGPGEWTTRSRRSGEWRDYKRNVTGYPAGMEYAVPGPDGPVDFDGFGPDAESGGSSLKRRAKGTRGRSVLTENSIRHSWQPKIFGRNCIGSTRSRFRKTFRWSGG
jgi:hypothetical protein